MRRQETKSENKGYELQDDGINYLALKSSKTPEKNSPYESNSSHINLKGEKEKRTFRLHNAATSGFENTQNFNLDLSKF